MTRLLLTGATGYIGGQIIHSIANAEPKIEVTALVRDVQKGAQLSRLFPAVHVVHGDLDDAEIIKKAAEEADVVVHAAATGHLNSVKTIYRALASRESGGYFIQISGATAIAQDEIKEKRFGEATDAVFQDLGDLRYLQDEIRRHPSRTVDNYFLDLTKETPHVKTAIVFAPIIYGKGEGPVHQRSIQVPELCRIALETGRGVQVGKGLNRWGNVHIADLGELFALLVRKAAEGDTDEQVWGTSGMYFAGAGKEISFGQISQQIVEAASKRGLISDSRVRSVTAAEIDELSPHASAILGTNAREEAQRAKFMLQWQPRHHSLEEEIPKAVEAEASSIRR